MNILLNKSLRPKIYRKENTGFTIIETLVAITVLMIAIAGPLVVASKGLNAALYARDQVIASGLAQESMEYIKSIKNTNVTKIDYFPVSGGPTSWLTDIVGISECENSFSRCDISAVNSVRSTGGTDPSGYKIYFIPTTGYSNHSSGSTETKFYRYYYLTKATNGNGNGACINNDTECILHVVVNWNEGIVPYSMELVSEITNVTP